MKNRLVSTALSLAVGLTALSSNAQDMYLSNLHEQTFVSQSAILSFKTHLDQRIADLKSRSPELYLETPNASTNLRDVILSTFLPANPAYKNREAQCSFIHRLLSEVQEPLLTRLRSLTQDGSICIAGDLPKELRINWTTQWLQLLWNDKWLVMADKSQSLEDLIIEKIGIENYRKPNIMIALREGFDGYGSAHSRSILPLFDQDPLLQQFKSLGLQFNPDKTEPFILLGEDIQKALGEESPYNSTGLVRTTSDIYISPIWPVAELVELLVHEYGHVLHAEQNPNESWNPITKTLYRKSNGAHNEGVAEAFSEMLLKEVFIKHPETETFHLLKLRVFSEIRPQDNHLQGAVALSSVFFQGQQDFAELLRLTRAESFMDFLSGHNITSLTLGSVSENTIPVYFKK